MNRYSRILHHIDTKDVKEKHLKNLAIQKEDQEKIKSILEGIKNNNSPEYSDWRFDIDEGMSTGGFQQTTYPASGEVSLDTITTNSTDVFGDASDDTSGGTDYAANQGTEIKDRGSGTGQDGGFDIDKHLSFDGDTDYRWAILNPVDSTKFDTMIVTAVRGNDTNGGEDPDEAGEQLELWYQIRGKTTQNRFLPIDYQYDGTTQDTSVSPTIIPLGSGAGNLREWTVKLPSWCRSEGTRFMLYQQTSSGTGWDNYGVTNIVYRRTQPISVVVGLDSPEASVFMRVAPAPKLKQSKKKRKKEIEGQLRAGEEYTKKQFGDEFPGSKTTLGPDQEGSPIGSEEIKKVWEEEPEKRTTTFGGETAKAEAEAKAAEEKKEAAKAEKAKAEAKAKIEYDRQVKDYDAKTSEQQAKVGMQELEKDLAPIEKENEKIAAEVPTEVEKELQNELDNLPDQDKLTPEQEKETEEKVKGNRVLRWIEKGLRQLDYADNFAEGSIALIKGFIGLGNLLTFGKAMDAGILAKINNNLDIAASVLTGKITNYQPTGWVKNEFKKSLKVLSFVSTTNLKADIPISDQRYHYADDNIYVDDNGFVHTNNGSHESLADQEYAGFSGQGKGYAQMVIPKDGGEPYLRYFDYNYHNLNSPDAGEIPGTTNLQKDMTATLSMIAHQIGRIWPGTWGDQILNSLFYSKNGIGNLFSNLQNKVGLPGWPPGIHGATKTDVTFKLSELPQEVQDMIKSHPLSWTEERVSNMSDDQLWDAISDIDWENDNSPGVKLYEKVMRERFPTLSKAWNEGKKLEKPYSKLMEKTIPSLVKERDALQDSPKYDAATKAAWDAYEGVGEKYEEMRENVDTEIPDPKGEYPKWDSDNDPASIKAKEATRKSWDTYQAAWAKLKPAFAAYNALADTLPVRDGMLIGTPEQIARLRDLESKLLPLLAANDRASSAYDAALDNEMKVNTAYLNKIVELRKPWDEVDEKRKERYSELYAEERIASDEAYKVYEKTFTSTGIEHPAEWIWDYNTGEEVAILGFSSLEDGGDYTDPTTGRVIPGKATLMKGIYERQLQAFNDMNAFEDEFNRLASVFTNEKMRALDEAFVPAWKTRQFESKYRSINPQSWKPGKGKGRGAPKPKPSSKQKKFGSLASVGGVDDTTAATVRDRRRGKDTQIAAAYGGGKSKDPWDKILQDIDKAGDRLKNQGPADDPYGKGRGMGDRWKGVEKKSNKKSTQVAHYEPQGTSLMEKKLKKPRQFFNQADIKPIYPDEPPQELDPKTGMHPEYGKVANRFNKLDPISARAMPATGDPEIDAKVKAAAKKPKLQSASKKPKQT